MKMNRADVHQIGNNTWVRIDMEFLFMRSTRYLKSERSEQVSYNEKFHICLSIPTLSQDQLSGDSVDEDISFQASEQ